MHNVLEIFSNRILLCAVASWFAAQVLKVPIYWLIERKFDWRRVFESGGMPSSHSAFVVSLALMVGLNDGFATTAFAITFTLAAIVMYDAAGVRRETGTQAAVLNRLLKDLLIDGKPISEDTLKELIGHTPVEVFAGAVLGLIMTLIFML
ncbi:MAG: divergent PAP2 family protein [Clostridia bacterium]|nr:divergent PAP2 family protein [Clostridia bacterium]